MHSSFREQIEIDLIGVRMDENTSPETPEEFLGTTQDRISNAYLWQGALASENMGKVSVDIIKSKKMDIYVRNIYSKDRAEWGNSMSTFQILVRQIQPNIRGTVKMLFIFLILFSTFVICILSHSAFKYIMQKCRPREVHPAGGEQQQQDQNQGRWCPSIFARRREAEVDNLM